MVLNTKWVPTPHRFRAYYDLGKSRSYTAGGWQAFTNCYWKEDDGGVTSNRRVIAKCLNPSSDNFRETDILQMSNFYLITESRRINDKWKDIRILCWFHSREFIPRRCLNAVFILSISQTKLILQFVLRVN